MEKSFKLLVIGLFILQAGCITYYKADPFSGVDFARRKARITASAAVSRYHATEYFDGRGEIPHTSVSAKPNEKYIREDIILRAIINSNDSWGAVVSLPIAHVYQRGGRGWSGVDTWGVEHLWLGVNFALLPQKELTLLLGVGVPIDGGVGALHNTTEDHNEAMRLTLQPVLSNGSPSGKFEYYFRFGPIFHRQVNKKRVESIFAFPAELRLGLPLGKRGKVGFRGDLKFTLINYTDRQDTESHDAIAIGPYLTWEVEDGWRIDAEYRHEVIGFEASAGSSWRLGIQHDFDWPFR